MKKRFVTIITACVLIILACALDYYGRTERSAGYQEGYGAAMKARDAELVLESKQHAHALVESNSRWIDTAEAIKADCLKWKPKQQEVTFDPLTAQ